MVALTADAQNLVPTLREHGYLTCLLGKNHLVEWNLHTRWFDATPGWKFKRRGADDYDLSHVPDPNLARRADYVGRICPERYDMAQHEDAVSVDEAADFFARARTEQRPFFALLDIGKPHPVYEDYPGSPASRLPLDAIPLPPALPIDDAPSVERMIRLTKQTDALGETMRRTIARAYLSMCEFADQQVARVLDALDRLELSDNTLVIYTADHGDFSGEHACYEKWDTVLYDCLTHVPLLMRLPGRVPASARVRSMVELIDIAPTIHELLGLPAHGRHHGRSLNHLFADPNATHKSAVYCQGGVEPELVARPADFSDKAYSLKHQVLLDHPESMLRAHMVRTDDHKLIYRLSGRHELYDLKRDPNELNNVFDRADYTHVRHELVERLLAFFVRYQPDYPPVDRLHA
jgi:choline-sulfatase